VDSDELNSFIARASAAGSAFPAPDPRTVRPDAVRTFTDLRALLLSPSHFADIREGERELARNGPLRAEQLRLAGELRRIRPSPA
jgi:hypothetical protein